VEARRRVRLNEERVRSTRDQDCQPAQIVESGLCQGRAPDGMLERPGLREDAGQVRGGEGPFPDLGDTMREKGASPH
jgi:hypothetical protein